ncbi:MAG: hypothetical protein ABSH20_03710 [Tepidisphaeraceae bacterium]|jgi:hypothetical protein
MPDWKEEHGGDYAVPPEIVELVRSGQAVDHSWHHDTCPCFGRGYPEIGEEVWLKLWAEHPDPGCRQSGGRRFAIQIVPRDVPEPAYPVLDTEDVTEAVRTYRWTDRMIRTRFAELKVMIDGGQLPRCVNNLGDVHNFCDWNMAGDVEELLDAAAIAYPEAEDNPRMGWCTGILNAVDGLLGWWLARQALPELEANLSVEQFAGLLVAHNHEQEEQVAAWVLGMGHAQIQSLVMCERFHEGGSLPGHVQALARAAYRLGLKSAGSSFAPAMG